MQASEAANVGVRFRILDLDARRAKLGDHFVDVVDTKIHHPSLIGIAEVFGGFGKRSENGRSGLLLPNGGALARRGERNAQVLLVPVAQRFGIMSAEEQTSNAGYFLHLRSSGLLFGRFLFGGRLRGRSRSRGLRGILPRHEEFTAGQNEAGPKNIGQDAQQLAPWEAHAILIPRPGGECVYYTREGGVLEDSIFMRRATGACDEVLMRCHDRRSLLRQNRLENA